MLSQISPPLTQLVVEEMEEDTQTSEVDGLEISSPESERPLPPGFPPFVFPEDDGGGGGIDTDEIGARFGGSATETYSTDRANVHTKFANSKYANLIYRPYASSILIRSKYAA